MPERRKHRRFYIFVAPKRRRLFGLTFRTKRGDEGWLRYDIAGNFTGKYSYQQGRDFISPEKAWAFAKNLRSTHPDKLGDLVMYVSETWPTI